MAGCPSVGGFIGSWWDPSPVYTLIQVMFSGAGHLWPHPQPVFFFMVYLLWELPCLAFCLSGIPFKMTSLVPFHWVYSWCIENTCVFVPPNSVTRIALAFRLFRCQ